MAKLRLNSVALTFDSFARMGSGFVVAVLLARQYGPGGLGTITTATALVTIVLGFSVLGLSGILVKELVENPDKRGSIVCTVTVAKLAAGVVLLAVLLGSLTLLESDHNLVAIVAIMGSGYLLLCFDTVDCLYNAREEFIRLVALRFIGLLISFSVKVMAIQLDWGLYVVALGYALDFGLMYFLPLIHFLIRKDSGFRDHDFNPQFQLTELVALLRKSWPVLLSGGLAQVNLRIDAVMIAALVSISDVGVYSAASRLSEAWSVIAMAIVTAVFPSLVRVARKDSAQYGIALSKVFRLLIWISVLGGLAVSLLSTQIIDIVYGQTFSAAALILSIHVFGGIFLFIRTAVSRWLIIEHLYVFSLVSHGAGAALNIGLNFALLPAYGIVGAAIASVVSYAVSGLLFLLLSMRTRPMFFLILWSALPGKWTHRRIALLAHQLVERRQE